MVDLDLEVVLVNKAAKARKWIALVPKVEPVELVNNRQRYLVGK